MWAGVQEDFLPEGRTDVHTPGRTGSGETALSVPWPRSQRSYSSGGKRWACDTSAATDSRVMRGARRPRKACSSEGSTSSQRPLTCGRGQKMCSDTRELRSVGLPSPAQDRRPSRARCPGFLLTQVPRFQANFGGFLCRAWGRAGTRGPGSWTPPAAPGSLLGLHAHVWFPLT